MHFSVNLLSSRLPEQRSINCGRLKGNLTTQLSNNGISCSNSMLSRTYRNIIPIQGNIKRISA